MLLSDAPSGLLRDGGREGGRQGGHGLVAYLGMELRSRDSLCFDFAFAMVQTGWDQDE